MAFLSMDDLTTDAVRVTSNNTGKQISVTWGATTVRLTVAEAVDLVDAVATVLGNLPDADALSQAHPIPYTLTDPATVAKNNTVERSSRDLARDEDRVRADAEVRESL